MNKTMKHIIAGLISIVISVALCMLVSTHFDADMVVTILVIALLVYLLIWSLLLDLFGVPERKATQRFASIRAAFARAMVSIVLIPKGVPVGRVLSSLLGISFIGETCFVVPMIMHSPMVLYRWENYAYATATAAVLMVNGLWLIWPRFGYFTPGELFKLGIIPTAAAVNILMVAVWIMGMPINGTTWKFVSTLLCVITIFIWPFLGPDYEMMRFYKRSGTPIRPWWNG